MKWHEGAFCSLRVHSDSLDETACSFLLRPPPLSKSHSAESEREREREVSKKNTRMANDLRRAERGRRREERESKRKTGVHD